MDNRLRNFLIPKSIQDEARLSDFRMLRTILVIVLLASVAGLILAGIIGKNILAVITMGSVAVLIIFSAMFLRNGKDRLARFAVPITLLAGLTFLVWQGNGIHDIVLTALITVVILASLTAGSKATLVFGILASISVITIGFSEITGLLENDFSHITGYDDIILVSLIIMTTAGLQRLSVNRLNESIAREKKNAATQARINTELRELQTTLENRVAERTAELEESTIQIQKRASQLEAIADVASSVASLQDVNELLPYITKTISQRFGFYHTGIFLLSEDKEYVVLRAANSEGGQKMLARKHQLRVGQEGIVGYSVAQKRARIALDVGEDAVFFNNPDLPATRSELALPLIIGSEVIGILDVQSEQPNAFSNEDIDVLTTLANQVAVAIENARLFQQSQNALRELDQTFQRYISNEWRQFAARSRVIGYRAYEAGLEPITEAPRDSEPPNGNANIQKIPIILRGATLGTLSVNMGEQAQAHTEEETNLIKTVADRLALALESARLLEDSQQAAAKEQIIGEITGKIGSSINLRNVLQTAVEELGRAIPGSDIVIQLNPKIDSEAK
jgi:GAF domain-containing protein